MSIKSFLTFAIIVLVSLFLFAIIERTNFFQRDNKYYNILNSKKAISLWIRGAYLFLFAIISSMAVLTMNTYLYPKDDSVFRNVDYHVLSHKGYDLPEKFYLANGYTSESNGYAPISLWDNKDGVVLLDGIDSSFVIKEYTDPIYIRKDTYGSFLRKNKVKSRTYHLVNQIIQEDVSNGFVLMDASDTLYSLQIEPLKGNEIAYISTLYKSNGSYVTDTSTFKRPITLGFPILDIIAKTPKIDITEDLTNWFEGAYLVRSEIHMDGNIPSFDSENPPSLCFMPGLSFYLNDDLRINGEEYDFKQTFRIPFDKFDNRGVITFFSGLGNKKTEEFRLSYSNDNNMRLQFLKPDMKHIKDTLGCVFINSSIEDISKESLSGGYMYNKFANEDNHNHINAHFMYGVGDARSELSINIVDLNSPEEDLQLYESGKEFLLHTRDKTSNSVSWIFEVTDLRDTNDLSSRSILIFVILMFVAVSIRVLSDSLFDVHTLSLTELAIYVILFSLTIVRLILGWRASTFVPIDDISLPMYLKMRTSIFDWAIWALIILPLVISVLAYGWKRFYQKAQIKFELSKYFAKPWYCLGYFFVALIICFVCRYLPSASRLFNIIVPLVLFFVFEILMSYLRDKDVKQMTLPRILASIFIFVYLFLADAGFTIIFFAYIIIHYAVLEILYIKSIKKRYYRYILSIFFAIILFLVLNFEGAIMMFAFNNAGWIITGVAILLLPIASYFFIKYKRWFPKYNSIFRISVIVTFTLLMVFGLLDALKVLPTVSSFLEGKSHMKYRAEIQDLGKDEKIDDLIRQCEFDSDDIIYIMRSAHNQWFINQYIRAGQKMVENDEYFHIQPHSKQGASYTTQTTDLVVTRYILAEHGEGVVQCILFLWLILIVLFLLEFKMNNFTNRIFLNGPIMLYMISLIVILSATNRIVFVGQDFPLISLQSKLAIIFPLSLLSLLICRCIYIRGRENHNDTQDKSENIWTGVIFTLIFLLFTFATILFIEQKGKDQEDSQFDVSRLISDISSKVDDINDKFIVYQEINSKALASKKINDVWELYTSEENSTNKIYYEYLNPQNSDFFSTLLHYFEEKQISKTDADQLLHLRRRGGKCYLAVNKKHYFIPSIMREEFRWTGDVYGAKVDPEFILYKNNRSVVKIDKTKQFEKNILASEIQRQIPDMPLMRFDAEWVPGDSPLFLVLSKQGQSHSVFFNIGADSLEITGDGRNNQVATAVLPGDVLSLYKKDSKQRNASVVLSGNMTKDGTPYIVRNMWINGHKQLFYPLGKQSMWTYHLGNLVSDVYSKNVELKDTSLYLSIDYNLCKAFSNTINKEVANKNNFYLTLRQLEILTAFNEKSFEQKCDSRNDFYYDKFANKIVVNSRNANNNLRTIAKELNKELAKCEFLENPLSNAIDNLLETQYDFTAVAIDGDGHIRAMFDYSRKRHIDPNNGLHLNRLISELYQEGSSADERDIFGSKTLQYIPVGPGSSFKPIAYTAITSQEKLDWNSIDVKAIGMHEAQALDVKSTDSGSRPYAHYGGVSLKKKENLNIQGGPEYHNNYLVQSNNLYHSVIILLGMQNHGRVEDVMRPYTSSIDKCDAFPVFTYKNGTLMCFDPDVWYKNKSPFIDDHDLLTEGLYRNFHIKEYAPRLSTSYTHLFGNDSLITTLYDCGNSSKGWVFPETSSLNNADRNQLPLRRGFNQILLGADPLKQTPLQMAVNASRLVSLNRSEDMVSILDGDFSQNYDFFDVGEVNSWTIDSYIAFMKQQVWSQLRNVPRAGTARALSSLVRDMENGRYGKPYYLYCKTGTLNDVKSKDDRMKHLMVIITDRPLERVQNLSELQDVRYYAMYFSYLGVNNSGFSNAKFIPYIQDVLNSNSFKNYMTQK